MKNLFKPYLICLTIMIISLILAYNLTSINYDVAVQKFRQLLEKHGKCPSTLRHMMNGYWKMKNMTKTEREEIEKFLDDARAQHGLNRTLQRNDYKCGNVPLLDKNGAPFVWFRALCDRRGKTPCCYKNICVDKTPEQCVCKDCYDMRQPIHAEYAEFIPYDSRCGIKKFTQLQACELLSGSTLVFIGDSYIRHFYTALLLVLRNSYYDGALKRDVTKEIHDQCTGLYMFTEKLCRVYVDSNVTNGICGGKVNLLFAEYHSIRYKKETLSVIKQNALNKPKSLLVFGIGFHDGFNSKTVIENTINPVIALTRKSKWPQLLWATPHSPGLLKKGDERRQSKSSVLRFISEISSFLSPLNIPEFNSFNMTDGVMSFDGSHYGQGVNLWKVHVFLNYFRELKLNGDW